MGQPYIGEIRMFGGSFAPAGWAMCDGQLMPISQNDALFVLFGTTYGGDGQETFAMPDLQGRIPVHMGQGPGISQNYTIGEKAGVESVTLTTNQIPIHNHAALGRSAEAGNQSAPAGGVWGQSNARQYINQAADGQMLTNPSPISITGGSQPHDNMMPYLVITFIVSLFGLFPNQN